MSECCCSQACLCCLLGPWRCLLGPSGTSRWMAVSHRHSLVLSLRLHPVLSSPRHGHPTTSHRRSGVPVVAGLQHFGAGDGENESIPPSLSPFSSREPLSLSGSANAGAGEGQGVRSVSSKQFWFCALKHRLLKILSGKDSQIQNSKV